MTIASTQFNVVPGCHCSQASYPPFLWIHRHRPLNIRFHCRNREAPVGSSEVLGLDPQLERRGSRKYNLRLLKGPVRYLHLLQGFIVPSNQYPIAMAFGSTFAYAWLRKNPRVSNS